MTNNSDEEFHLYNGMLLKRDGGHLGIYDPKTRELLSDVLIPNQYAKKIYWDGGTRYAIGYNELIGDPQVREAVDTRLLRLNMQKRNSRQQIRGIQA